MFTFPFLRDKRRSVVTSLISKLDDGSARLFQLGTSLGTNIDLLLVRSEVGPSSCWFVSLGVYLFPALYILFAYA